MLNRVHALMLLLVVPALSVADAPPKRNVPAPGWYCVTAEIAGVPTRVHTIQPADASPGALRGSLRNALALSINQAEVASKGRSEAAHDLARWRKALAGGVSIAGIDPQPEASRPTQKDPGGDVVCVCLTFFRATATTGARCDGGCLDCMACTIR